MPKNRIQKHNNGKYYYQITINSKRRSIYQRKNEKLKDFEKRCNELDMLAENGNQPFAYSGLNIESTFDELFRTWQKEYQIPNNSKSDVKGLENSYKLFLEPIIGQLPLHKVDRALIYRILNNQVNQGYSKDYIAKTRACISRTFNWARNQLGLKIDVPTTGIKLKYKKIKKPIRVISYAEADLFFEHAIKTRYYNYFKLLLLTGLRPSEALGLQVGDIKNNYLEVNRAITKHEDSNLKTESGKRKIPITDEIKVVLSNQLEQTNTIWLFPTKTQSKPNMFAIESCFKRIMKKIKPIKFVLYDFRHTFATRAAESGMPFNILQKLMGHKTVDVTLKYYVGISSEQEDQAMSYMQKLNGELSDNRHEQNNKIS